MRPRRPPCNSQDSLISESHDHEPARDEHARAAAGAAARTVIDPHRGTTWRVREADARGVPGARRVTCLVFDSPSVVRRLWDYPAAWRTASDAELLALLE